MRRLARIFPISDIHLELPNSKIPRINNHNGSDTLVLAGDIGNPLEKKYKEFLTLISDKFNKTFLVSGNHEYWNKSAGIGPQETDEIISDISSKLGNVIYLQKGEHVHNGVRYLGCTLWGKGDKLTHHERMDSNKILGLTYEKYISLHNDHKTWLTDKLSEKNDYRDYYKNVVITHHMPSISLCDQKYKSHISSNYFYSDSDELVSKSDLWICGHSHTATIKSFGKSKCVINPYGYPNQDTGFNLSLHFDVYQTHINEFHS